MPTKLLKKRNTSQTRNLLSKEWILAKRYKNEQDSELLPNMPVSPKNDKSEASPEYF